MEIEGNNNNKEISPKDDNNDQINKNKDLNFQESTNEEKTYDIIKSIASSILSGFCASKINAQYFLLF